MTPSRRAAETAKWTTGKALKWSDQHWTFIRFDPQFPRALCRNDKDQRHVFIDITTATPISLDTERKRAERLRRKEAGEVRIEAWISRRTDQKLKDFCESQHMSRSEAVEHLIRATA